MTESTQEALAPPRQRRSYAAQVVREVLLRWGARIGLTWILLLVMVAVFAPFLATSHPLLAMGEGGLMAPVLTHLTAADVTLLAVFFTAVAVWFLRRPFWHKLLAVLAVLVISGSLSHFTVSPPELVIYEQHREAEAAGQYDWVLWAPVPYSPKDYLRDFGDTGLESPLADEIRRHWLGTEENGADVLSRMIHASRIALGIGFIATGIALGIGIIVGGLMGYFSGIVDIIGMRIVEIFEAIPTLFLLLTFVAFFGRSLYMMMIIIGITSWSGYARYVRAEFLKLREQDYVQAAVACGLPLRSVLFRHMLPNGVAPILVAASFGVASAILAEATLSFLGLGLVDDPSWGQMLNQAVQSSSFNWWMAAFPGGAIFLTVFAYNLVGESLRDALDPYLKKKA
ncbi:MULTISPECIES: ABC transporter permease [Ectothiorhodospira]|uniref:ABC transporter permease n=1 Tax=Ectothiorhodospira TaxID=1051 RepID=UPI001EE99A96|nr:MULTISPECIES: ABC transporter permease [Ectothiorhodospira]MCG5493225.1 ABC transporter permease [Ectothiorhodospira variabilis]MCG5497053.1 ABC transporter permease [Ectothiorhodospira variabilis]MCG5502554.1 ABC transporter permease [Ectothiorhodospira variabilis]MCG5505680.1 ABC transporter permease [Ectothiorhodospira variabilis]MCG5525405.1 ABC transporter permease [Ectothiorhodospira haloalkaliphila]